MSETRIKDLAATSTPGDTDSLVVDGPVLGTKRITVDDLRTLLGPSGAAGLSLLGTGSGSAFGVPKTKCTVTNVASYAVAETDRVVIMTNGGSAAVTLNGTAPPSGFARVVRIVADGPSSVLIKDPASSPIYTLPGFIGAYVDLVTEDGSSYQVLEPSLANGNWFGSDAQGDLPVRGASLWARLAKGTEGYQLVAGASTLSWDIPLTKVADVSGTPYTMTKQDQFLLISGTGAQTVNLNPGAPPAGFMYQILIVVLGSGSKTIKDGGGSTIATLTSADFPQLAISVDGVNWGIQAIGASVDFANTATVGSTAAAGAASTALRSDATIILSFASEARGDIIKRGASTWGRLAIGAAGKALVSDGTDPSWDYPKGAGGLVPSVQINIGSTTTLNEVAFVVDCDDNGGMCHINALASPATDEVWTVFKKCNSGGTFGANGIDFIPNGSQKINGVNATLTLPGSAAAVAGMWTIRWNSAEGQWLVVG